MLSKKHICSVQLYGCERADEANVLIELPHGATLTEHYNGACGADALCASRRPH